MKHELPNTMNLPQHNFQFEATWNPDNTILLYRIHSVSLAMMEDWSASVLDNLATWSGESSPLFLYDLTYPNVSMSYFILSQRELVNFGITRRGQSKFLGYLQKNLNTTLKLAVVISPTMLGALSQYIPMDYMQPNYYSRIFFNAEPATEWLTKDILFDAFNTDTITSEEAQRAIDSLRKSDEVDYFGNRDHLRVLINDTLEVIPIQEDAPIIIGRASDATFDVSQLGQNTATVSRRHAQLTLSNGRLTVIDLGSRNGTFLSSRRLDPGEVAFIRRDEVFRLGQMQIKVLF